MRTLNRALLLLPGLIFLLVTSANADLVVRDVHSTGAIDSLADSDALFGGTGIASETTVTAAVIDYLDADGGGGTGNFGNNFAFPNDNAGSDDDDFAIHVTGVVRVETAGDWTFGASSDDGSRLRINGADVILDDTLHAVQNSYGTVNLAVGWHDLDFVFFERGGGAGVELFASLGTFTSFTGNNFQLLGDVANGGLMTATAVPEPGSVSVLAIAMLVLLSHRKKRTPSTCDLQFS